MKKLFLASLLTMGLSIPVMAAPASDLVPTDSKGNATNPLFAGASTCVIDASTGTSALLCDTGAGVILDIIASSVTATDPIVLRDSATANTTSTVLFTAVQSSLAGAHVFPRYKNGLSANVKVAPGAVSSGSHPAWVIIYRALD